MATDSLPSAVSRRLEGKVALITGGASGIGECTAKLFARHGAKVVIADIQDDLGHSVCESIGQTHCKYVHCDVTAESQVRNAVDEAVKTYGKLDIMFNNAGIADEEKARIIDNEKADFERVMSVNVTGVFLGIKHAAQAMIPAKSGSIISTASVVSNISGAMTHAYTCSKHAVVGLTKNTAVELGQFGIRVNCLSPYLLASAMTKKHIHIDDDESEKLADSKANLKHVTLKAEDVANAALFLASDEGRLEGKVALITGGASGIGECTAKVFAHHGAKLVIADIQDELGDSVSQSIGETNCRYIHCDVTDESHVKNAVEKAVKTYGKLDIMFNNAGVANYSGPRIVDNEKAAFERVLSVNVTGVFLGIKHASQAMISARSGSIISTASICSYIGGMSSHAYTCSKHAVVGLTKNAAVELGQFGIRVNCVSPYGVATPLARKFSASSVEEFENAVNLMANLKHVTLKAEDVANAALFLASEEGRYINGHNFLIDGGFSIVNPSFHMFQYPEN